MRFSDTFSTVATVGIAAPVELLRRGVMPMKENRVNRTHQGLGTARRCFTPRLAGRRESLKPPLPVDAAFVVADHIGA
jgi:hypothetical protein